MSEGKKNGCMKAAMIFFGISFLLVGVLSAGAFFLWKKTGSRSLAVWKAQMGSAEEAEVVRDEPRPMVARAPISAGADTYARYLKRKDVLTLVNYYSDT
jgi:hypothetical protein